MIQLLAAKHTKDIAYIFLLLFMGTLMPAGSYAARRKNEYPASRIPYAGEKTKRPFTPPVRHSKKEKLVKIKREVAAAKKDIGGPSQPERSTFKSVSSDNLVNLFTGDFSYNIPLLDVDGYPINIFYDGGITMEQEASWVGLGWNINPGSVSRNMRGVPDDFNGDDILKQKLLTKPNKTWGVNLDIDLELVGIKALNVSVGGSVGVSFNNYLGPALDIGTKGNIGVKIANKASSEKMSLSAGAGLGANINSRSGLTLSPNVSLTAGNFKNDKSLTTGIRLGTSWNSKSGIHQLQISGQMSQNYEEGKKRSSISRTLLGTSISFAKPSYIPSIRVPLNNEAYAGRFQLGGAIFGVYASAEVEVYKQTSEVSVPDQTKQLVGYLYYQQGVNNPNMVMDFTRLNDNEVTPNTPIISAPQYTYDVFTIQGEGTGGSIRVYRNDLGYVRDNTTSSRDRNQSAGVDIGIPGHYGANYNRIQTPTVIGEWLIGNKLRQGLTFGNARQTFENVYFKNPGETTVLNTDQFTRIGGTDLVRYKMGGSSAAPTIEPLLERFSKTNELVGIDTLLRKGTEQRAKRSQIITFLTAGEASIVGLDKSIKNYNNSVFLTSGNNLNLTSSTSRINPNRKTHHISEITVAEEDGKRYIYGLPVYNIIQKDFSFSVDSAEKDNGTVGFTADEPGTLKNTSAKDGYIQVTETPPYANSFLLSGILSPDYIDIDNNGITENDLGQAVKFNYTSTGNHAWRTPMSTDRIAHFNAGNRTNAKDDKGIVSYGLRESWYLHSVESKSMIALFTLEDRNDGNGVSGELSGINTTDNSLKRLKKIDLYNKADLKKNGMTAARPIKTVWFGYSYNLCTGTPDNTSGGKLTLDSIWFTYNGQKSVNKNKHVFSYTNEGAGNPSYALNATDRWGNYKPDSRNPSGLKNKDYPYGVQDKAAADQDAAAWGLKKILLPSGAQIDVTYESDDYAFVQDRRSCNMLRVVGLGVNGTTITNKLYQLGVFSGAVGAREFDYVFIQVPEPCATKEQVFQKYLQGQEQLAFKIAVNMPNGVEYVPVYATVADYGARDSTRIWVRLNKVDGMSPLTLAALDYLREQLPGQAYPGYDVSDGGSLKQAGEMLLGLLDGLKGAFKDPIKYLRSQGKAQTIDTAVSFVRLNDPDGFKYGGGHRVRSVILKDTMARQPSIYGQTYDYTTTETYNGVTRTISSGVASYEPGIGSEENPFLSIVQVSNKLPLGPASYGAIEMPVLDAFFPAPTVGYSKVTVRSLKNNYGDTTKVSRSGIGKQVTEFYTAKDYPVYYQHTSFDPGSNKEEHKASLIAFFSKYSFDSRALSQGFLVATNDMHGKMRSQSSYAENDSTSCISYVENFYRNTGSKGLNEKFDFVYASQGGVVAAGNMGIDIELMTDTREFSVKSTSFEIQGQVDLFPVLFPFWLPFIWPVSGESEDTYRAVTTTKVISYHGILDSVVVIDKGSMVSTKNLVYDAETGSMIVNRTNNEFDKPMYTVTYPAWWAYSGMGPAYKNIDATYTGINFYEGKIITPGFDMSVFESGDELYVSELGKDSSGCVIPAIARKIYAFDKNKSNTALTVPVKDLVFLDPSGYLVSKNKVNFRIIRSGKRNMLDAQVSAITMMSDPIAANPRKLIINSSSKVINASVTEFREKWQTDNDLVQRYKVVYNYATCSESEVVDCNGYLEKKINPYVKGLLGNFRPLRSQVFYGNRNETDPLTPTNLPQNGFLNNFKLYWDFNAANNLVPDNASTQWVWNTQNTRYNTKGKVLETRDALNIYSAAQYGYNKSVPVAMVNNGRYHEMAAEGFEDVAYAEALNTVTGNSCARKHINLTGLTNTRIVNSTDSGFAAHTGKYMLGIDPLKTASGSFAVSTRTAEDYPLPFNRDTTWRFDSPGGNIHVYEINPPFSGNSSPPDAIVASSSTFTMGDMTTTLYPPNTLTIGEGSEGPGWRSFYHQVQFSGDYYIEVAQAGTYQCTADIDEINAPPTTENWYTIRVEMMDDKGNTIYTNYFQNYATMSQSFNVTLCKGIHLIRITFLNQYYRQTQFPESDATTGYVFSFTTNASVVNYKRITKSTSCNYNTPIAVADTMLNPIFNVPAGKKMVFSAWVRENCGNAAAGVPCSDTTYTKNEVQVTFNTGTASNVTLKPTSAIIEGWQRYEGYFTAPAAATQMTLNLVNNSNSMLYFDDIRLHPFNANMNSYVYDPVNMRLVAELDANNYALFYEYDEEGNLIRTKAETKEGVKTINETRNFQQSSKRDL